MQWSGSCPIRVQRDCIARVELRRPPRRFAIGNARFVQAGGTGPEAQLVRSPRVSPRMSLPSDRNFVNESIESPEDPLGFFPSENQKKVPVPPARPVHVPDHPRRDVVRTATRVRFPLSAVAVSAFACGVVIGGSAMWLAGATHQPGVGSTAVQQTLAHPLTSVDAPREVQRAPESPVAPVATAFGNTPVVQPRGSQTAAATTTVDTPRPPFRGSLVVNSSPSGARVFVNGRGVGETPLVLRNQPAGSRAIRVALDGYEPWSAAVQIVADTETHLRAELRAQRPSAQP